MGCGSQGRSSGYSSSTMNLSKWMGMTPDPMKNIQEVPHSQVEIIMGHELAKWIRDVLDAYLKQTEPKPDA